MKKKTSKMDYLKEEDFFQQVSSKCNYINTDIVRDVYYSLVKVVVQELRHKGVARLPDFGDMVITMHRERNSLNVNTGMVIRLPSKKTVKFLADYKLKKYLNSI